MVVSRLLDLTEAGKFNPTGQLTDECHNQTDKGNKTTDE